MILKEALQSSQSENDYLGSERACSVFGKSDTRGSIVVLVDMNGNSLTVL